jgi:hypothetical protein
MNEGFAEWMRRCHPLRLQYDLISSESTATAPETGALPSAETVRVHRHPVAKDNPFWAMQEANAQAIEMWLDTFREVRDNASEILFQAIYGSPFTKALAGLRHPSASSSRLRSGADATRQAFVAQRIRELEQRISEGGAREAAIRALLYIRLPGGAVDERGFRLMQRMREEAGEGLSLADFKKVVRDQFFMLLTNEKRAVEAIPAMLAHDPEGKARCVERLRRIIEVVGLQGEDEQSRLREIENLIGETRDAPRESTKKRSAESKSVETDRAACGRTRVGNTVERKH